MRNSETRSMMPWRVTFWIVLIHAGLLSVGVYASLSGETLYEMSKLSFPIHQLGFFPAAAVWIVFNSGVTLCAFVAADLLALALISKLLRRSRPLGLAAAYLICGGTLTAAYLAALLFVAGRDIQYAGGGIYFDMPHFAILLASTVLSLPLALVVTGLLWRGMPKADSGFCLTCGYNLTGNTSGVCPECGTALAVEAKP